MQRHRKLINDIYESNDIRPWHNVSAKKLDKLLLNNNSATELDDSDLMQREDIGDDPDLVTEIKLDPNPKLLTNVQVETETKLPLYKTNEETVVKPTVKQKGFKKKSVT